jgi:hypothetical protein
MPSSTVIGVAPLRKQFERRLSKKSQKIPARDFLKYRGCRSAREILWAKCAVHIRSFRSKYLLGIAVVSWLGRDGASVVSGSEQRGKSSWDTATLERGKRAKYPARASVPCTRRTFEGTVEATSGAGRCGYLNSFAARAPWRPRAGRGVAATSTRLQRGNRGDQYRSGRCGYPQSFATWARWRIRVGRGVASPLL